MKLSICIPTYNRATLLADCLNSIILCERWNAIDYEVCVSNNNSSDNTEEIIREAGKKIKIKYNKNYQNIGITRNFLKVVSMASGEFIWLIGDDDLLLPTAITKVIALINEHPDVDFFYVNSFHLNTKYIESFPRPFDTKNLPGDMEPFSKYKKDGELKFLNLVDPKISFDFLGGIFLSVFRKSNWDRNVGVLDQDAIMDERIFSHFDNTFPQIKIFANAFSDSKAYFNSKPINVCLTGAREWSPMYPLIHGVRLIEALSEYRKNGLPYWRYLYCKNYALNNFLSDFANILLYRDRGYVYINPFKLLMQNCLFPNFYLSLFYFIGRRLRKLIG